MRWLKQMLGKAGRERAQALVAEGVAAAHGGDLAKAERHYGAAADADPDYALAHLNLALARMDLYNRASAELDDDARRERLQSIEASLERALSLDGDLLAAWRCLGHVSSRLQRWSRAEEAFTHLLEVAPDDFPHRDEARAELRAIAPKARRARAVDDGLRLLADSEAPPEQVTAVIDELKGFLEDPELPTSGLFALGALLRREDDEAGARDAFERCVARDRGHVEARRALASLFMARGDLQGALAHSLAAYREDPSDAGLVCNVGVCHLGLGDLDAAAEYIGIARGLAPRDPIVLRAVAALDEAQQARARPA